MATTRAGSRPSSGDLGWAFVGSARKAHYYDAESRSLCGRYVALFVPSGAFEPETGPHRDDCVGCRRTLGKRGVK